MYTEYRILEKTYADVGDIPLKTVFTYNHFCLSWYAYLSLLDIDVSLGFSCKVCGTTLMFSSWMQLHSHFDEP